MVFVGYDNIMDKYGLDLPKLLEQAYLEGARDLLETIIDSFPSEDTQISSDALSGKLLSVNDEIKRSIDASRDELGIHGVIHQKMSKLWEYEEAQKGRERASAEQGAGPS